MARKPESSNSTGLAVQPKGGTALATYAPYERTAPVMEGAEATDLVLPRAHVYQGLPDERKRYGNHQPGDIVNSLTQEKYESKRFTVIRGYKSWTKWRQNRGEGPEYSYGPAEKHLIPPADLVWGEKGPAAQEYLNFFVLFEGADLPAVLSFTKTSLKSGRSLSTMEQVRANLKRLPGLYELETVEKENKQGTWLMPRARPDGDCPPDLLATAEMFLELVRSSTVKTDEGGVAAGDAEGFDPDSL